jgi:hypothetical protein
VRKAVNRSKTVVGGLLVEKAHLAAVAHISHRSKRPAQVRIGMPGRCEDMQVLLREWSNGQTIKLHVDRTELTTFSCPVLQVPDLRLLVRGRAPFHAGLIVTPAAKQCRR